MKENFNPEQYREDLAKKLINTRSGDFGDKVKDIFSTNEGKTSRMNTRHEEARNILQKEKEKSAYWNSLSPKLQEKEREFNSNLKEDWEKVKLEKTEKFKNNYPNFESFLQNPDFEFLIHRDVEIISLTNEDPEYERLLSVAPKKEEYSRVCAFCGANGDGVKIVFENNNEIDIKDVRAEQKYIDEGDDAIYNEEIVPGEKVSSALARFNISNQKHALICYKDDGYNHDFKQDLKYFKPFRNPIVQDFLVKKYPKFFVNNNFSGIKENINGYILVNEQDQVLPISYYPVNEFLKENTKVYLIDQDKKENNNGINNVDNNVSE